MTPITSSADIAKLLGDVQKESNGIDELLEGTSQGLEVDYAKCISCVEKDLNTKCKRFFTKSIKASAKCALNTKLRMRTRFRNA